MKLIASRYLKHDGKLIRPGEEFTEHDKEAASELIAVGAARAVNNAKKTNGHYKRRDMRAEE